MRCSYGSIYGLTLGRIGMAMLFAGRTVARSKANPCGATSSRLLSIARLNIARSRSRCSTCSFVRIAQTCLVWSGVWSRAICLYSTGPWAWCHLQVHLRIAWPNSSIEVVGKRMPGGWIRDLMSALGLMLSFGQVTAKWQGQKLTRSAR